MMREEDGVVPSREISLVFIPDISPSSLKTSPSPSPSPALGPPKPNRTTRIRPYRLTRLCFQNAQIFLIASHGCKSSGIFSFHDPNSHVSALHHPPPPVPLSSSPAAAGSLGSPHPTTHPSCLSGSRFISANARLRLLCRGWLGCGCQKHTHTHTHPPPASMSHTLVDLTRWQDGQAFMPARLARDHLPRIDQMLAESPLALVVGVWAVPPTEHLFIPTYLGTHVHSCSTAHGLPTSLSRCFLVFLPLPRGPASKTFRFFVV